MTEQVEQVEQKFVMNPAQDAYRVLKEAEEFARNGDNPAADLIQVADRYIRILDVGRGIHLTTTSEV